MMKDRYMLIPIVRPASSSSSTMAATAGWRRRAGLTAMDSRR
jgi:hypothetical protein